MLDGWYCRTLANEEAAQTENNEQIVDVNDETDSSDSQENDESRQPQKNNSVDYKTQYRYLKKKLKFLIYENEFFQDALRSNQRRLLKVSRDRSFLLDRLLQYEKPKNTSSESEETEESSEDEATKEIKKRKLEQVAITSATGATRGRKKKATTTAQDIADPKTSFPSNLAVDEHQQIHVGVERPASKQSTMDLLPERTNSVPQEMFSNEPSLDSEPTDHLVECSSPTHVAAEECVPMEYSN
ncbi:uncharacterized protein LOC106085367 [Stomoxys calcitrans]|uniref:INO80 complex subunit E N-terminal domain-containing protein n=1 Tax=Stomoxys calcitrans TaxID=35570 RepID=A0A1I8QEL8_STOCA|nr:uncharacterized protein LOC106085367 [Stomoxys calcitrans]